MKVLVVHEDGSSEQKTLEEVTDDEIQAVDEGAANIFKFDKDAFFSAVVENKGEDEDDWVITSWVPV